MMNEIITLILLHKAVFYYDAVALGFFLAAMTVYIDVSSYFSYRKHWCEHNKIKSIKDDPKVYEMFMDIYRGSRKQTYLTTPWLFFKNYKFFLATLLMYLSVTILSMGYVIGC